MVNYSATEPLSIAAHKPALIAAVVELTIPIDSPFIRAHRSSIAAAFGMCAGLAFPTVTHEKGGK